MYIIKQSNLEPRINFINRAIAKWSCDIHKVRLIYIKSSGKPQKDKSKHSAKFKQAVAILMPKQ